MTRSKIYCTARLADTQFTGQEQKFTFYAIDDSTMMLNYSCKFIFTQCAEFLFRKAINKTMIRILTNSSSPSQNEENIKKYRGGEWEWRCRKRRGCSPGGWRSCPTCWSCWCRCPRWPSSASWSPPPRRSPWCSRGTRSRRGTSRAAGRGACARRNWRAATSLALTHNWPLLSTWCLLPSEPRYLFIFVHFNVLRSSYYTCLELEQEHFMSITGSVSRVSSHTFVIHNVDIYQHQPQWMLTAVLMLTVSELTVDCWPGRDDTAAVSEPRRSLHHRAEPSRRTAALPRSPSGRSCAHRRQPRRACTLGQSAPREAEQQWSWSSFLSRSDFWKHVIYNLVPMRCAENML